MFLYREEYYLKTQEVKETRDSTKYNEWIKALEKVVGSTEVIIAKHRNGAVGSVVVQYSDQFSSIGNFVKPSKVAHLNETA